MLQLRCCTNYQTYEHIHEHTAGPSNQQDYSLPYEQLANQQQTVQYSEQVAHHCMWNGCPFSFLTRDELVRHVNHHHLPPAEPAQNQEQPDNHQYHRMEPPDDQASQVYPSPSTSQITYTETPVYPSPPSSIGIDEEELNWKIRCIQHELGTCEGKMAARERGELPPVNVPTPSGSEGNQTEENRGCMLADRTSSPAIASSSNVISSTSTHSCAGIHYCRWASCSAFFDSCDNLTAHLNTVHVGSGKARYDCFWDGCDRNGERGLGSKQKICRHLQVCCKSRLIILRLKLEANECLDRAIQVTVRSFAKSVNNTFQRQLHCSSTCEDIQKKVSP